MHDGMRQARQANHPVGGAGTALLDALDPTGLLREESRRLLRQQRRLLAEMREARRAFRAATGLA